MKWVMGIFAEDMSKTTRLVLWDLICQTDVFVLVYAVVEVFRIFREHILRGQVDQINELLKIDLKNRLAAANC